MGEFLGSVCIGQLGACDEEVTRGRHLLDACELCEMEVFAAREAVLTRSVSNAAGRCYQAVYTRFLLGGEDERTGQSCVTFDKTRDGL